MRRIARIFALHLATLVVLSMLFRCFLMVRGQPFDAGSLIMGVGVGLIFDFAAAVYSFFPILLFLLLSPRRVPKSGFQRGLLALIWWDFAFLLWMQASEVTFYNEFTDRFNFIAVDYLVYSSEVLRNIWESYPIVQIAIGIIALTGTFAYLVVRRFSAKSEATPFGVVARLQVAGIYAVVFAAVFFSITETRVLNSADPFVEMVGKNNLHALFAAYRNNEIKFDRFYTVMPNDEAVAHVYKTLEVGADRSDKRDQEDARTIVRNIRRTGPAKNYNVIYVLMESMSARFLDSYGNQQHLTPNLDRLASEGIFFNHMYSTGTRTVRGLEATTLSIPPTPGQSIVRRPGGTGLFNIGSVFREQGYKTSFIYGGRSLFDNMGAYFEGNGFSVYDQTTFPANEITFANAWGVADGDLFKQVIKEADQANEKKEKFFHFVLTTSNHRPYTFPQENISRKSGSNRDAAIEYSDYAIGQFLKEAETKPWFDSTIFVFVADHNAAVAGGARIHPNDYLIPVIFYNPKLLKQQKIENLSSQIDIAPTLLSLLNFSYQSRFFGVDLFNQKPERAFIATYQKVAYLSPNEMVVLAPNRKIERFPWVNGDLGQPTLMQKSQLDASDDDIVKTTVSFYKTASDWFSGRLLEERERISNEVNVRKN